METISNAATTASKMIWGESKNQESGTEPVSGQTGKGTTGEPYDTGNEKGTETKPSPSTPLSM